MGEFFGAIGGQVLEWILPSLLTAVSGLVAAVLVKQLRKLGLELTAEQEKRLREIIREKVRAVEERARRDQKSGRQWTSEEKAALARAMVRDEAPGVPTETIDQGIDAELPELRALVPSTPASFGR